MKIINTYKSPNFDERPIGIQIDTIVIHYTDTKNCQEALDILCNKERQVSAHYLIDEDGTIYNLVEDEKRAWHAGESCWRGKEKINNYSIGIELSHPGHLFGYREFKKLQIDSLVGLCKLLVDKYKIDARNIVGHSDIAPNRKKDPGELFPWKELALKKIGLFPEKISTKKEKNKEFDIKNIAELQNKLHNIGYKVFINGKLDEDTINIIKAFKSRFIQDDISHQITQEFLIILDKVEELYYIY